MMFDIIAFKFRHNVYYAKETYRFPSPNITAAYYSQIDPTEHPVIKGMSTHIAYWISWLTLMGIEQSTYSFVMGTILSYVQQCRYLSKHKAMKLLTWCVHIFNTRSYCKRLLPMAIAFLISRYKLWDEQIINCFLKSCTIICLPAVMLLLQFAPNKQVRTMINKKARALALKSKSPHNVFVYIKSNPHDQEVADHLYEISNSIASACILIAYYTQVKKDKRFIDKAIDCTFESVHYCRIWETYILEHDYIPLKLVKYCKKWFPIDVFASSSKLAKIFLRGG